MKFHYWLLTAAYCAAIFWLSSLPKPPEPPFSFPGKDKLAHAVLYGGLAGVVSLGMRRSGRIYRPAVHLSVPIVFAGLYGITDEVHQVFVPPRSFEVLDIVANTVGAAAFAFVLMRRTV